jgi:predicted N-acetyltransferase YhbS
VLIRPKTAADEAACIELMRAVHLTDGYPRYWPADPGRFVTPPAQSSAWVAEEAGTIVGHVALHDAGQDPTLPAARAATNRTPDELAVLARLLVDPRRRRAGLGRRLIAHATDSAARAGRRCVLDVVKESIGAIRTYEALGWRRVDELTLDVGGPAVLQMWVYVGPVPADSSGAV